MISESDRLWIKICGVRDVSTAVESAKLGADAIGLNFYERSPRFVGSLDTASKIVRALPETAVAVGVFVNREASEIREICSATGVRCVQLHGDEPDCLIGELSEYTVIRALRPQNGLTRVAESHLDSYRNLNVRPVAWLVDARVEGAFGGTGHTVDWRELSRDRRRGWPPLILAGGLTPENVAEAVSVVAPAGVDVASGVESEPGVKEMEKVEQFITACR